MSDDPVTEIERLLVKQVHGVTDPANGTSFLLMKSAAQGGSEVVEFAPPPGHGPGCECVVCVLIPPAAETEQLRQIFDEPESDAEGETVNSVEKAQRAAAKQTSKLLKALADSQPNISDPVLKATVGERVTYERLKALNARRFAKDAGTNDAAVIAARQAQRSSAVESLPGQSGVLGALEHERQIADLGMQVVADQQQATAPFTSGRAASDQLQAIHDGTAQSVQPAAPLTTPQLDFRGLEKARTQPTPEARQAAGEQITLANLAAVNRARGLPRIG